MVSVAACRVGCASAAGVADLAEDHGAEVAVRLEPVHLDDRGGHLSGTQTRRLEQVSRRRGAGGLEVPVQPGARQRAARRRHHIPAPAGERGVRRGVRDARYGLVRRLEILRREAHGRAGVQLRHRRVHCGEVRAVRAEITRVIAVDSGIFGDWSASFSRQ